MKKEDQEEGSRNREMWVGDRLRRYRHNNQGMESCIRAKQPICSVQWQRRRCGPDLITRGCLWQTEVEKGVARLYQKRLIQPSFV